MLNEQLQALQLPALSVLHNGKSVDSQASVITRRAEIRKILQEHIYGVLPPAPQHLRVTCDSTYPRFGGGSGLLHNLTFTVTIDKKEYSFPVYAAIPKSARPCPAFILLNFRSGIYDEYIPAEEIIDHGYAVFGFNYRDVASDDGNFKAKLAGALSMGRRAHNATGKIAMWAWAAMRVMDYVMTLPEIDHEEIAVIGHSRLGKTALFTAAMDERFRYAFSNDSGSSGAALARGATGEDIACITTKFGYWFCPRYRQYAKREFELPFDQHFLTALIAPRHVGIGSAQEDLWASPHNEFLNAYAVGEAYQWYGKEGLRVPVDDFPVVPSDYSEGNVHYHIRTGVHYLSRRDWLSYMDFMDKKRAEHEKEKESSR